MAATQFDTTTASTRLPVVVQQAGSADQSTSDEVARETAVALVYNGISHAVMMASPVDLEDFALGFSLSEGILEQQSELYAITPLAESGGVSLELEISSERWQALKRRRRSLSGRTGCGLCGIESLQQAIRPVRPVRAPRVSADAIQYALGELARYQPLQGATGATHAAAWCRGGGEIAMLREDVGRHNALDKLLGGLVRANLDLAEGFVLVSSRASYEMVHKSCSLGIGALVAISAPTTLAIAQARTAGQLLAGFARPGRHIIYNDPHALVASTFNSELSNRVTQQQQPPAELD